MLNFLICALLLFLISPADARTFGGHECTEDCSGHKAGYEWAEARNIVNEAECGDGRCEGSRKQ
jgi:hypothetical protein